jgi:predicted phage-related endonuclease
MLEIFTCPQGSDEWFKVRRGIPSASEFHAVLAKGEGKTRRTYMMKLIGERLTGESSSHFTNEHTERGHVMEAEARAMYSFDVEAPLTQVGFVRRTYTGDARLVAGCSPDSLVGEYGLLEIKTKLSHLQLEVLLADKVPTEHVAQCQGALWVTGRKWLDFVSYWPGLPLFKKRVYPDLEYFDRLGLGLIAFELEIQELMAKIPAAPTTRAPRETGFTDLDQEKLNGR